MITRVPNHSEVHHGTLAFARCRLIVSLEVLISYSGMDDWAEDFVSWKPGAMWHLKRSLRYKPLTCVTWTIILITNSLFWADSSFALVAEIVTWLILPVVICLSQRLSHACLSINKFILWNCEWLIKSVIVYLIVSSYMDNRSKSRANTC